MPENQPKLNINSWLEDELYETYRHNRQYVDESWKSVFEANGHSDPTNTPANGVVAPTSALAKIPVPTVNPDATDQVVPLRGVASKIAENMALSLSIPLATSQRTVQVRLLEENRALLNQQRTITGKSKI